MKINFKEDDIVITISNEQKELIEKVIKKYSIVFSNSINKNFDFKKTISRISEVREKTLEILNNVYKEFKIFSDLNVTIILTGSFARGTNRFDSDLDLNFIYDNKYKEKIFIYEELYMYSISKILKIPRNRIHSVITTKLNKRNLVKIKKECTKQYLTVTLKNNNWQDSYQFYPNTKKRFYLEYANSKNMKSFIGYIKKEIKNRNREWAHNFFIISSTESFLEEYEKLLKIEKKYTNKLRLVKMIDELIKEIEVNNDKNVKKKYQVSAYYNIYNTLEIARLYLNLLENESIKYFNLFHFVENKKFLELVSLEEFEQIYNYLFLVEKLAYILSKNNEIFSIHYDNNINKYVSKELKKVYTNIKDLLIKKLKEMRKKLYE